MFEHLQDIVNFTSWYTSSWKPEGPIGDMLVFVNSRILTYPVIRTSYRDESRKIIYRHITKEM